MRWAWAGLFGLVVAYAVAAAEPMRVMGSLPAAHALMDATNTRFYVRFSGAVDHAHSTLTILQGGHVVQVLHPRLNSSPDTLYGSGARLQAGSYELRWATRAQHGSSPMDGSIPFMVGRPPAQ